MNCRVEILPTAWEDLKKIEDHYILEFSVESAVKVTDSILDSLEHLERFPDSGSQTPDAWLNSRGYRMVICGKFASIYRKVGDTVFIYHIANTQTDYTKLFY